MNRLISPADRTILRLPHWLGDVVACEPVLRAFYEFYRAEDRASNLTVTGSSRMMSLFKGRFEGAARLADDRSPGDRPKGWRGQQAALLLTNSFRSAWFAFRAGVPIRVGWARDGRGFLLTHGVRPALERGGVPLGLGRAGRRPRILPRPFGSACVELAQAMGVYVRERRPLLEPNAQGRQLFEARLKRLGLSAQAEFVAVNVGARAKSAKAVPPQLWASSIDALARRIDLPILVVCGPGEREALHEIKDRVQQAKLYPCADPVVDLPELVVLAGRAALFLTSDTGARHVALATGAPIVAILGPTDPRHAAEHLETTRIVRQSVPCGPCHLERCPLQGSEQQQCLSRIDPEQVAAAAVELLERR
jgi:heptosyltransferase-2